MEINWFILIVLVFISFFVIIKKSFRYIDAFVLFIPFNATAVFFTTDHTAVNLPLTLFFLSLGSYFLRRFFYTKFIIPASRKTTVTWLITIGLIAIISQIMPYIINGDYMVLDRYKELIYYAEEETLYPSIQWVTQTIYFLIGLLIVFTISVTYRTLEDIKKALKLLLTGITFMVFWGWLGDLTYFIGIPYPQLFNQIGMQTSGMHLLFNGFPRMISVTLEASYFAQILIPIIPYFYWFSQQKESFIFYKSFHKRMYILSMITILLAITTTGVLGFILLIGLWLKNNIRFFSLKSKYFLITLYSLLALIAMFFVINYITSVSDTYSGIERFKTVYLGVIYFIDYPVLGLGWGVFPTHDFIVNLLVNFGLIGTIPFLILMYNIFRKLQFNLKKVNKKNAPLYKASLESFILILIVSQLSGFNYHSQYFWLYIGLSISIGSLKLKNELS